MSLRIPKCESPFVKALRVVLDRSVSITMMVVVTVAVAVVVVVGTCRHCYVSLLIRKCESLVARALGVRGCLDDNDDDDDGSSGGGGDFGASRHRYMSLFLPKCESPLVKVLRVVLDEGGHYW